MFGTPHGGYDVCNIIPCTVPRDSGEDEVRPLSGDQKDAGVAPTPKGWMKPHLPSQTLGDIDRSWGRLPAAGSWSMDPRPQKGGVTWHTAVA